MSKSRYLQGRGPMTGTDGVRGQGKVELEEVANGLAGQKPFGEIIGRSQVIRLQIEKARRFARYDSAVLICGETGTGKGIFARAIHLAGSRSEQPFVRVNCGALPADLIENELFGHVAGAFTGAVCAKTGLIEQAQGGTLFLDEINSVPVGAQPKLLHFLDEGECRRLGSACSRRFDVRVISASNSSLPEAVRVGQFRKDLYFRLNVLSVHLPALRQRREDIPLLADYLLVQLRLRLGARQAACPASGGFNDLPRSFTAAALKKLMDYDWPGNVRELRKVIEMALVLSDGAQVEVQDLRLDSAAFTPPADEESFNASKARVVWEFEHSYLKEILARYAENITCAAKAAGKNRRAFFELLRKHNLLAPSPGEVAKPTEERLEGTDGRGDLRHGG